MENAQPRKLHPSPVPGIPIVEPHRVPDAGQVILGYEVVEPSSVFFTRPDPSRMNVRGWVAFATLLVCFWPASCIPCFTSCSYGTVQRPVYGTSPFDHHID